MHGNLNMKLAYTIHKYVVYGTLYTYSVFHIAPILAQMKILDHAH